MDISISRTDSALTAKIIGAITEVDGELLRNAIDEILQEKHDEVRLDLSLVPIMTSTGIGKLIVLLKKLKSQQRVLKVIDIHQNLFNMFVSINLDKMIPIEQRTG